MIVLRPRNVHSALQLGVHLIQSQGVKRDSRNGEVLYIPEPVTTVYAYPLERVVFWPERDANPFFHLFEALWMLAGRNDVEFPAQFAKNIANYSDDGTTLHGAYGHRWRRWFGFDQLREIINNLERDPNCRRQMLQMWDVGSDLINPGKDVPCNFMAHFQVGERGQLDMTVSCRSNDMIWGAYGANAVHFSILQEYVAAALKRIVGRYWQVSDNFHVYRNELWSRVQGVARSPYVQQPYSLMVSPVQLVSSPIDEWNRDLDSFLAGEEPNPNRDPFFRFVAWPLLQAHRAHRAGGSIGREESMGWASECQAPDWRKAAMEWLTRRAQ